MPIGNMFPIYFSFENDSSEPDTHKPEKMKSVSQLLNHLKTCLDHITQRKRNT